jgi:uncharacterized protein (TIGR03083 family)
VDVAEHLTHIQAEGLHLADAASDAGLDAAVPGCPDWQVRDLVAHVGEVHRWATAIVDGALAEPKVAPPAVPDDSELLDWFRVGHAALVEALRAAPADLDCFAFLPAPSPLAFWARRQALELAIHRSDAEAAAQARSPINDALALDGMDELLNGFGARKKEFAPVAFRLAPGESAPWFVILGAAGLTASQEDPGTPADVTVTGSAGEVYRWMWNRPAEVTVEGDPALVEEWQKIRVRWS